ncbi:cytochrome P450 4d2-like isoform X2 [Onthophagus taurus]|nr:cytochrome P450 4d2-like [Onthophagus taurus]
MLEMEKKFGKTFRLYFAIEPNVMMGDSKSLEFLLSSNSIIDKSATYDYFNRWLGTGLLTSTGEKWRKYRKTLTPAFHFQILEQFMDVFNSTTDILIEKLSKNIDKPDVDIYPFIQLCALDVICESSMGTCINAQLESNSKYVKSVKEMARIVIERGFSPIQMFETLYKFTYNYYLELRSLKVLHNFSMGVIQNRKSLLENEKVQDDIDDFGIKKRLTFLDILLKSKVDGKPIPDVCIREEVDTFMFAGHDTTSSAITFTLYCLSNHQEIQQKVIDELKEIYNNDWNRPICYRDLQSMKYLESVIKESLRLYPPVPLIGRQAINDVEYDNKIIPKGTMINVFIYGVHRNPDFFPDPLTFKPDRFKSENTISNQNPYAYIPFSAGTRNCIGQKFAMLEIKATVSKILRHFELFETKPRHQVQLTVESILKSNNGVKMSIRKRKLE